MSTEENPIQALTNDHKIHSRSGKYLNILIIWLLVGFMMVLYKKKYLLKKVDLVYKKKIVDSLDESQLFLRN
jgi:hypothetical protein